MSVGKRIKQRREEIGMTQAELAKKVGTTYQAISKYENDIIGTIPTKKLKIIAEALDCSPVYLLGMEQKAIYNEKQVDEMRDELKDNPDLRILLSAASDLKPEDIRKLTEIAKMIRRD
jgi:transcriptional regulator with XRE-family HTH domain